MCTRRHFVKTVSLAAMLGPALLEQSMLQAARLRAADVVAPANDRLFDIQKVADGVYAAIARPQLLINSNACIIVNDDDVMVVDTHSKPSAARSLIAQIRREVTPKPVRYVVNTHFHWDHAQGNHAYPASFPDGVEIVSSEATRQLLLENGQARLRQSIDGVPKQLEELRGRLAKASDAKTQATITRLVAEGEAYMKEMRDVQIDLPTMTFNDNLVLRKKSREIQMVLLGRGHTSGDVVVFLPKEKVVATGDLAHGFLPFIGDGYPKEWPATLDKLRQLDFTRLSPGHGAVQEGKNILGYFRDYLEELAGMVEAGLQKGRTVEQLQKEIAIGSLRSLNAEGYLETLRRNYTLSTPTYEGAPPALEGSLAGNIADIAKRLNA